VEFSHSACLVSDCPHCEQYFAVSLTSARSLDPSKIRWEHAEGFKGKYKKSEDYNNREFKRMVRDLAKHGGKLTDTKHQSAVSKCSLWSVMNGL